MRKPVVGFSPDKPPYPPSRRIRTAVFALLTIHTALLAYGAYVHSPTFNEPAHLVAGIEYWKDGNFFVYRVNPPLVRMVAATPVLLTGFNDYAGIYDEPLRTAPDRGAAFVKANGERSLWLVTLARWVCIPFSLLGAYICYCWARDLYGRGAGLLALCLWCFEPNIIAHGQVITCDAAATALGLASCYRFWCWLRQPSWVRGLASGLVLGLAELTKMTFLIFFALWPFMWFVFRWPDRSSMQWKDWLRELAMLAVQAMIALYLINLGYGFEGSGTRVRDFQFRSAMLANKTGDDPNMASAMNRFAESWFGSIPVPLPKEYVRGIDQQRLDFEKRRSPSYLRGEFSTHGWWYYYLYAMAIKLPLGIWLLILLAITVRCWVHLETSPRDDFVLLAPAAAIFLFVSSQAGFSEHMRYVLPVFPFLFIFSASVAGALGRQRWVFTACSLAAVAWAAGSSLYVYPHSLSYFNELVGGPPNGPKHLIHSNVDWGQDLLILKRWLNAHPEARPIRLAYFGFFDPRDVGIEYSAPEGIDWRDEGGTSPPQVLPGWYAISVNFVQGFPAVLHKGNGSRSLCRKNALSNFQKLTPVATAGYSIYIYHVPEE